MGVAVVVGQILFMLLLGMLGMVIARLARLELSLACVISGVLGGLSLPFLGVDTGIRAGNVRDLVFFVILPILIFEAAWAMKPAQLRRWLMPILVFATIGVLISWLVIAALSYIGIGHASGFPWLAALLTGAMLSVTDPVAVINSLKQHNAPEELAILIEGESLFNDATGVVLFTLVLGFVLGTQQGEGLQHLTFFLTVFFGGVVCGVVAGLLAAIFALVLADKASSTIVLVVLAFASFYVAEHFLHVSGIMAVMCAALTSKLLLHEHEDQLLDHIGTTWSWLGRLFTVMIFVLMGLVIQFDLLTNYWLAILIAIAASLFGRAVAVYGLGALSRFTTRELSLQWQTIMVAGGLRGAIAIALVLSLPAELPYWPVVQAMVFGVVLFSLVVQAPASAVLIKRLHQS